MFMLVHWHEYMYKNENKINEIRRVDMVSRVEILPAKHESLNGHDSFSQWWWSVFSKADEKKNFATFAILRAWQ